MGKPDISMKYHYDVYVDGRRVNSTDKWSQVTDDIDGYSSFRIDIQDMITKVESHLNSPEDVVSWEHMLERDFAWKPERKEEKISIYPPEFDLEVSVLDDKINPKHYKEILPGWEYMEMMQYILKRFSGVEAHLVGQIFKYLLRMDKDEQLHEWKKTLWYLKFLIAYRNNSCKPIKIADIEGLLEPITRK